MNERVVVRVKLPLSAAGIYPDINIEDYHSPRVVPDGEYAVSSSDLRTAWSLSLAHCYDRWAHNPKRAPREPSRPMILGSAAHHLLLAEDGFKLRFVMRPEEYPDKDGVMKKWTMAANYCKDWVAREEKAGKTVVTPDEIHAVRGMSQSMAVEPLIRDNGLMNGLVECSGLVKDKETGIWIKVRPDVIPTLGGDYVDMKTINDITTRGLKRRLREAGYHQQGALIWEWCDQMGMDFTSFTLVFVESSRPHCVRIVPVDDDDINRGRLQNRLMLRQIAECIELGHWPGPNEGDLKDLSLPVDEREYIDSRLHLEGMI